MTVSRTDNKAKFNCNGSTYQFAFEFPVQDDDDVVVVLIDSSGGETVLTKGTHYAIAESDSGWSGGGTVTTQTSGESGMENYSYASGYSILLYRSVPLTQLLDLYTGRNIDLQDLEDAFDKLQMQMIDLQRQLDRCIKVPDQDTSPTTLIANAASRANKFIAFDADGDAQASSGPVTGVTPTTFAESLLGAADAEEARDLLECADLLDTFTVVTTTPYSCDGTEKTIIVNSGSAVTLNLATLSAYGDGANLRIFNIGAGAVTVDASGTETIMGALTISLVQNMGVLLVARTASGWTAVGVPAALSISEAMIAPLAVTEGKIGALAVTEGKIGALAVTEGKIGALAVTEGKIGSAAVTNAKLGTGSVTSEKMAYTSGTSYTISSSDAEKQVAGMNTWVAAKTILVARGGTISVSYDAAGTFAPRADQLSNIYKNGVAVGTQQQPGQAYATYTESIAVAAGDQISIYLHPANVGGATMWTQNFRIKAGYPVTETVLLA